MIGSKAVSHLKNIHVQDTWSTPQDLFNAGCTKFNHWPTLDVCATLDNMKCNLFFSEQENALRQEWRHDWFCNPPYSKVEKFIKYGISQCEKYDVNGLFLTFAKVDTRWFHNLIWKKPNIEVDFIRGRVRFLLNGKAGKNSAPYPSMWIFIRGKYERG